MTFGLASREDSHFRNWTLEKLFMGAELGEYPLAEKMEGRPAAWMGTKRSGQLNLRATSHRKFRLFFGQSTQEVRLSEIPCFEREKVVTG